MRKPYRSRPMGSASVVFASVLAAAASPGWGWNATGHKVVAMVAWADLTPAARAAVSAILRQHPRYAKDLLSGGTLDTAAADPTAGLTPDELDRRAFAAAAVWPDLIRAQGHPMHVQFNRPSWHYIDLPYVAPTTRPTTYPTTAPPADAPQVPGPHDVVEALTACVAELRDPATPAPQRAVDVCWIAHLVGDVHQPLHACALVSAEYPTGDAGGNDAIVLRDGRYPNTRANLHAVWDSLLGEFASDDLDRYEAQGLRGDPRYARSAYGNQLAVTDFMAWAKDSYQLAVTEVYLDGQLRTAAAAPGSHRTDGPVPALPPGYLRTAEQVALRQVALAGYRLADLLNGVLDPTGAR